MSHLELSRTFHTVKLLTDHLSLSHENPRLSDLITCGIDNCLYMAATICGFRHHVTRKHVTDWNLGRYKRWAEPEDSGGRNASLLNGIADAGDDVFGDNPHIHENEDEEEITIESYFEDYPRQLHKKSLCSV